MLDRSTLAGPPRLAPDELLGERRALVGALRLGADQEDPSVEALLAKRLGGLLPARLAPTITWVGFAVMSKAPLLLRRSGGGPARPRAQTVRVAPAAFLTSETATRGRCGFQSLRGTLRGGACGPRSLLRDEASRRTGVVAKPAGHAGRMSDAVLVAGGTGALGGAVLAELLAAGRPVTATYRTEAERDRTWEELGGSGRLDLVAADLMDPDSTKAAVAGVEGLGAVVNLVGGFAAGPLVHETELEEFERMLTLNLRPGFLLARAAMPRLAEAEGAAWVGVSARPALRPFPGAAGYVTAKAAVLAFTQALDAEYAPVGVRCNAILPSVIDAPANRRAQPDADHSRWVPPEQIAKVIRFLVSEESAPTSGAAVPVYGRA